jgi:hypothetical protein
LFLDFELRFRDSLALFGLKVNRAVQESNLKAASEGLFSGCFGSAARGKFALESPGVL